MNTTIGQMEEAVKGKIELIEKDRSLTGRLRAEASLMFDLLISRLEQYKSAQESGAHALIPIHAQTLQDIPTCALKLGVSNRERLDPFLVTNGARYNATSRSTDPTIASKSGTNAAPSGTPKTQAAAKEQVKTMPKFTWATTTKPVECAQKASLLEIQKEELESKGES